MNTRQAVRENGILKLWICFKIHDESIQGRLQIEFGSLLGFSLALSSSSMTDDGQM